MHQNNRHSRQAPMTAVTGCADRYHALITDPAAVSLGALTLVKR